MGQSKEARTLGNMEITNRPGPEQEVSNVLSREEAAPAQEVLKCVCCNAAYMDGF